MIDFYISLIIFIRDLLRLIARLCQINNPRLYPVILAAPIYQIVDFPECARPSDLFLTPFLHLNLRNIGLYRTPMSVIATASGNFKLLFLDNVFEVFSGQMHSVFFDLGKGTTWLV